MLRNTSLFKSISQFIWPEYNDVASVKSFLCNKRGLTSDQADAEVATLMNMQAGLLCLFYDQGLRGDDIRYLHHEFSNFLKLSSDLMYPDGKSFDRSFMQTLADAMTEARIKPFDALSLVFVLTDQHEDELHADIAAFRNKCLDAVRLLRGLSAHDTMIFLYLVKAQYQTPQIALQKIINKDADIIELHAIESPAQRPGRK